MTTCQHPAAQIHSDALLMTCPDCGAECNGASVGDDGLCYDPACPLHVMAGEAWPTEVQITALRTEAAEAGDLEMVAVCNRALAGEAGAILIVEHALSDAAAQEQG